MPVDVPEEDGPVEARGGEVLLPPRVLDVLHPVRVAVQRPHLVLQVPEIHQGSAPTKQDQEHKIRSRSKQDQEQNLLQDLRSS